MGRLEWLTALALGRGHYEDEVIYTSEWGNQQSTQLYNDRGYPRNPETKRRERENVRAANEVMQVTGVVEDSLAAKTKKSESENDRLRDTFLGLRLLEFGRSGLIGGVWGVIGLRRRVLLYKSYTLLPIAEIMRRETAAYSFAQLLFAGFPSVIAYHLSDWALFVLETFTDSAYDSEGSNPERLNFLSRRIIREIMEAGFCYITIHFRMFAILQQLNLFPSSTLFPSLTSFIPFSHSSPLQLPSLHSIDLPSIFQWSTQLLRNTAPLLAILIHGKIKYAVSKIIYRPIYKIMPRPTGESMFSGLDVPPSMEFDTPDQDFETSVVNLRSEDEPTLRALEGSPSADVLEARSRNMEREGGLMDGEDDDDELTHATLISFDVEATEAVESSLGTWSAELRSANEPKLSENVKYRVTGLTMLPTILATEGLRDVVASVIVMPLEALMVRVIARDFEASAGSLAEGLFEVSIGLSGFYNLLATIALQTVVTGVFWAGYTLGAHVYAIRRRAHSEEQIKREAPTN